VLTLALNQELSTKAQASSTGASVQFVGDKSKSNKSKPMRKNTKPSSASSSNETCSRCGGRHPSKDCRRVSATDECRKCGKRGHFAQVCRQDHQQQQQPQQQQFQKRPRANYMDDQTSMNILFHNTHEQARDRGWMVNVRVEGTVVPMLIDTGATDTVISEKTWRDQLQTPLVQSTRVVRAYGGRPVAVKGECDVAVKTKKFEGLLRALITPGGNVNLMGRDWIEKLMPELAINWIKTSAASLNTIDTPREGDRWAAEEVPVCVPARLGTLQEVQSPPGAEGGCCAEVLQAKTYPVRDQGEGGRRPRAPPEAGRHREDHGERLGNTDSEREEAERLRAHLWRFQSDGQLADDD
jgi:predicted aspartyl protease